MLSIMRTSKPIAAAVALAGCLTACSAGDAGGFHPSYGQDAVQLARHVPSCSQIRRMRPTRIGTAASCVVRGHRVEFVALTRALTAQPVTARGPLLITAVGQTWYAHLIDAHGERAAQRRVLSLVARALRGKVV